MAGAASSTYTRKRLRLALLYAADRKGVIGVDGKIPWDCKEDMAHFKKVSSTPNSVLVMGYNTWESLPVGKLSGEKLAGRKKIVITRKEDLKPLKDTVFMNEMSRTTLQRQLLPCGIETAWIIGGAQIIVGFMHECDSAHITRIEGDYGGDIWRNKTARVTWSDISATFGVSVTQEVLSPQATVLSYIKPTTANQMFQGDTGNRIAW